MLSLSITYQNIPLAALKTALNVDDVAPIAASQGWTVDGDLVRFPLNAFNQPKPRKFKESIELSEMRGVVDVIAK